MNQFVQRVVNYVANEVIIKGLANSRTFQRFAVRTDASLKEAHKTGSETLNSAFEQFAGGQQVSGTSTAAASSGLKGPPQKPLTGFPGFVSAFFKEIRKDLGMGH
jgi:hypothetical protein